jgi:hypothetical protein
MTEIWVGRQDLHNDIHNGRLPLDDLDVKILAILDKSPFESARSIAETLSIAHSIVLLHLHWMPHLLTHNLGENERSMQKRCCYACMLPNVIVGIILWLVISLGFSWIHHHIACGLCREVTWLQSRDLIFRAKIHVYNHVEPERLLCCRQTSKWYQNEQRLFCDKDTYSIWTSDLSSRKGAVSETTCDSSWQSLSSYKSGFNRLARRTWHAPHATCHMPHSLYSSDLAPVTSTYFLQWKKNSNGFKWLTRTNCLSECKRLWGVLIKENWMAYFRLGCNGFKK